MAQSFQTIQLNAPPQASDINRIQANIQTAFGSGQNAVVLTVNSSSYPLTQIPDLLMIPTVSIPGGSTTISLPDATQSPGTSFPWKKSDSTSNQITFIGTAKNKQGSMQTVEGSSSYSTTSSLAAGWFFSDGNNWWLL